jgi:hypothetical protein
MIAKQPDTRDWQDSRMASFLRLRKRPNSTFSSLWIKVSNTQNLTGRKIAIIVFRPKSNRLKDLLPLVPACLAHIESIQPGQIVRITAAG